MILSFLSSRRCASLPSLLRRNIPLQVWPEIFTTWVRFWCIEGLDVPSQTFQLDCLMTPRVENFMLFVLLGSMLKDKFPIPHTDEFFLLRPILKDRAPDPYTPVPATPNDDLQHLRYHGRLPGVLCFSILSWLWVARCRLRLSLQPPIGGTNDLPEPHPPFLQDLNTHTGWVVSGVNSDNHHHSPPSWSEERRGGGGQRGIPHNGWVFFLLDPIRPY